MRRWNQVAAAASLALALIIAASGCAGSAESPDRPLRILISNDDGIQAPGIVALAESLRALGAVTVAAPPENRSGASHGMTFDRPISVLESEKNGVRWLAIDALPATCVRMAIENFLPEKPDFVLSGINRGPNLGTVTFYSATVAAAREAAFQGIPAISVNLQAGETMEYAAAAEFVAALVKELARDGLERGLFLNVNWPALPKGQVRGVMVTRQDTRAPLEFYEKRIQNDGEIRYWPSYKHLEPAGKDTDIWALWNGYVSITPFTVDQTSAPAFKELQRLEKLVW